MSNVKILIKKQRFDSILCRIQFCFFFLFLFFFFVCVSREQFTKISRTYRIKLLLFSSTLPDNQSFRVHHHPKPHNTQSLLASLCQVEEHPRDRLCPRTRVHHLYLFLLRLHLEELFHQLPHTNRNLLYP